MQPRFVATLALTVLLAVSAAVIGRLNSRPPAAEPNGTATTRPSYTPTPIAGAPDAFFDRVDEQTQLRFEARTDRSLYYSGAAAGGIELRLTPVGDLPRIPVDLVLVVDTSGSMQGEAIANARAAALELIDGLQSGDTVSIVSYADRAERRVDRADVVEARDSIRRQIGSLSANGGTCISCALEELTRMNEASDAQRARRIVMLSDGNPTVGLTMGPQLTSYARVLAESGWVMSSVGVGRDYNAELMQSFADTGHGNYFYVAHAEGLGEVLGRERVAMADIVRLREFVDVRLPNGVGLVAGLKLPGLYSDGFGLRWRTAHMPREGVNIAIPFDMAPGTAGNAEIGLRIEGGEQMVLAFGRVDSLTLSNESARLELTQRLEVLRAANELQLAMVDNMAGNVGLAQERIQSARGRLNEFQGALGGHFEEEAARLDEAEQFLATPAASSSGVRRSLQLQNAARARELTTTRSNNAQDDYHDQILVY